jgi:hypothetical protein
MRLEHRGSGDRVTLSIRIKPIRGIIITQIFDETNGVPDGR